MNEPKLTKKPSATLATDNHRFNPVEYDNIRTVLRVIQELEQGRLRTPAVLENSMRRDDRIAGCLHSRTRAMSALPFVPETADESTQAKQLADEVALKFFKWFPAADIAEVLSHGLLLGQCFGQVLWDEVDGQWAPRLKVWNQEPFWFDWTDKTWKVQAAEGVFTVTPGDGSWFCFTPFAAERSFRTGLMRNLFLHWMARQWGWRDWGRWSEVYGSPIRGLKTPSSADKEEADRLLDLIAAQGAGSAISLPQGATKDEGGYELELIEAKSTGTAGFKDYLAGADANISIAILGQTLTTEVSGASLAAAKVHQQIRNDILKGDAQALGQFFRSQVLRPWAEFNFGVGHLAPTPCWNTEPPEDKEGTGKALMAVGQGVTALFAAGIKPDVDLLTERLGIPTTGPAEEPKEEPAPGENAKNYDEEKVAIGAKKKAQMSTDMLDAVSGQSIKGAVEAQKWVDGLAAKAKVSGGNVVAGDLLSLLRVLEESNNFDDFEARLVRAYGQMDSERLAELIQRAMVLSDLAGRWGGKQDTQ